MDFLSGADAHETNRLSNLAYYDILDSLPEQAYDDITLLAAHICQMPVSLISFIDGKRQWPKSHFGSSLAPVAREVSFCAQAILEPHQQLVVEDAEHDERFAANPFVGGAAGVRFYAGVPLVTPQGYALGTLCVIDTKPNALSPPQTRALDALARQVVTLLDMRVKDRALKQALSKERQLQALKSKFVSLVAHEFRTPLTTIAISADLLTRYAGQLRQVTALPLERPIERINEQIKTFTTLLDKVLVSSQLEAGKITLRLELVDIVALSQELIRSSFSDWPDGRAVTLNVLGAPERIRLDARLINYVLSNLLTNALKFSDQNPELRLRFEPTQVLLQVIDQGIGIPAGELSHLFDPFYRASNADSVPGTGLGLSIAREFTQLQGASLQVDSQLSQGSTFTIKFDKLAPELAQQEEPGEKAA